jgi:hypothetical protein
LEVRVIWKDEEALNGQYPETRWTRRGDRMDCVGFALNAVRGPLAIFSSLCVWLCGISTNLGGGEVPVVTERGTHFDFDFFRV